MRNSTSSAGCPAWSVQERELPRARILTVESEVSCTRCLPASSPRRSAVTPDTNDAGSPRRRQSSVRPRRCRGGRAVGLIPWRGPSGAESSALPARVEKPAASLGDTPRDETDSHDAKSGSRRRVGARSSPLRSPRPRGQRGRSACRQIEQGSCGRADAVVVRGESVTSESNRLGGRFNDSSDVQ